MNLRKNLFQFLKAVFSGFAIAVPIFIALVVGYWRGHKDTLEHQETPSVFTQKVLSWFSDVEPEKMGWIRPNIGLHPNRTTAASKKSCFPLGVGES